MGTPYKSQDGRYKLFLDQTLGISASELAKDFETVTKLKELRTAETSDCAVVEFHTWEDLMTCVNAINATKLIITCKKSQRRKKLPRIRGKSDCKCMVCRSNTQQQVDHAETHKLE